MAELADARDLKSREIYFSYRFDPGFRHHHIAEWSSLVARRAHNPKVVRFKSHLRNQRRTTPFSGVVLLLFRSADFESPHDLRRRSWVSKSKRPGGSFGRREVPQSKEFSEPRLPRRKKTTMRPGRAMKNPTSATKEERHPFRVSFFFYFEAQILNRPTTFDEGRG